MDQSTELGQAVAPWSDDQTRQHLQVLVEGVATLAGFEQSAVTLRRNGHFEVVAAAGVADGFVGMLVPAGVIEEDLASAEEWGVWRFIHHDRARQDALDYSHIPDITPLEGIARSRNVIIEFPSVKHALDCYNSEEYQAAKAIRVTVADAEMVVVEGYEG